MTQVKVKVIEPGTRVRVRDIGTRKAWTVAGRARRPAGLPFAYEVWQDGRVGPSRVVTADRIIVCRRQPTRQPVAGRSGGAR